MDNEEQNLPYLAGFFEGEGSVYIVKNNGGKYSPDKISYSIRATLTNGFKQILEIPYRRYGGYIGNKGKKTPHIFEWVCVGKTAKLFLMDIQPFLIAKSDQVELALFFYENRKTLSDEESLKIKQCLSNLKDLK